MKGDQLVSHTGSHYAPEYPSVTSDEYTSASSDQESFDGKVINDVRDETSTDWHLVNKHRTSMRKLALTRTASAPIRIPSSGRSRSKETLHKTYSCSQTAESNKIVYNREQLLGFRYSPMSMTPPSNLSEILEATKPVKRRSKKRRKGCKCPEQLSEEAILPVDSCNEGESELCCTDADQI